MSMLLSRQILISKHILVRSNCCLEWRQNLRSAVRRLPSITEPKPTNPPRKVIEEVEERVDLKGLQFSKHLSATARLALEANPDLLKAMNANVSVNEAGDICLKSYKFAADSAARKLGEMREELPPVEVEETAAESLPETTLAKHQLETSEDPNEPVSSVACGGCGATLHCQNKNSEGFIPASEFKEATKKELIYKLCLRCYFLKTNKKIYQLESNFDHDKFIAENLCSQDNSKKRVHVVLLVDLLDMPNSIYAGWSKLMEAPNLDIVIVGNKLDLLPDTGPGFYSNVMQCLVENFAKKDILGNQIKHVELVSAKNGYNIEKLITMLFKTWNDDGDVYLLGSTNAGKSVLFNRLLASDYCRPIASTALSRASTSFWPGTTLNTLKFPINFLNDKKFGERTKRLLKDRKVLEDVDNERYVRYQRSHDLKDAELLGIVGKSFNSQDSDMTEVGTELNATYSLDSDSGRIIEGENFSNNANLKWKLVEDARELYRPNYFKSRAAFFYDTPGVVDTHAIQRYFSKQELQIVSPAGIIMPRTYWMQPGQTMFISGLMRVDLIETTNNERALFTIMASPALPVINPFATEEADDKYNEYYEMGTKLRVPHKQHSREKPLPELVGKEFTVKCIGNHKSMTDIVFSNFGWIAVNSLPDTTVRLKAYTLGGIGLEAREPSLLPFVVNMRSKFFRKDGSQAFKSKYYIKPKIC